MWNTLGAWLTLDDEGAQRLFHTQWNFVDRVFKVVQWSVVAGIMAGFGNALIRGGDTLKGLLLVLVAIVLSGLAVVAGSFFPGMALMQSRFPPGETHRRWEVLLAIALFGLVSLLLLAIVLSIATTQLSITLRHA